MNKTMEFTKISDIQRSLGHIRVFNNFKFGVYNYYGFGTGGYYSNSGCVISCSRSEAQEYAAKENVEFQHVDTLEPEVIWEKHLKPNEPKKIYKPSIQGE